MDLEKEAYGEAIAVLEKCSTPHGFYAAYPGYNMVFARDSMIISLGASLVGDKFKKVIANSLKTLAKNQSKLGQIPNAVDNWSSRKKHVDFKSIDSTLWFLIGLKNYEKKFGRLKLDSNVRSALNWLRFQDFAENGMLVQLPTTDWQDAFPHRYGFTINTQALYYHVLRIYGMEKEAVRLKKIVNENEEDGLWNDRFYIPWRWKNHGEYHEKGEWFDSLGNFLAIIYGLAGKKRGGKILDYISRERIAMPYPIKAIYPAIRPKSKDWQDYFLDAAAGTPWHYLNGGIWTYIGGFYVCALLKAGKTKEAAVQLNRLAEVNLKYNFAEWLHGRTGKLISEHPEKEGNQGWNAAMFIVASQSSRAKRALL